MLPHPGGTGQTVQQTRVRREAAIMALPTRVLVLLVAHSVSATAQGRHFPYHVHTVHFNPVLNTSSSTDLTAALLQDGGRMVSGWMEEIWSGRARMEEQTFPYEWGVVIDLLEVSYNGTDDCETERSSTGVVALLNTAAEHRHDGEIILHFNVSTVQCAVLDSQFLPTEAARHDSPNLGRINRDYLVERCMEELLRYLEHHQQDSRRTAGSEDEELISEYTLILLCIAGWMFWRARNRNVRYRDGYEVIELSGNVFDPLFDRYFYIGLIQSIISRIKRKISRRRAGKPQRTNRGRLHVLVNEDQGGDAADRPETGADEPYDQITVFMVSRDGRTRTARLITAGGQLGSRTISVPAFGMEGEEGERSAETNPQDPALQAVIGRLAASMDIPPTLAENHDGQIRNKDRLTAG
ncbi:hypothetical protein NFI96_026792, partial [Prochilodus magdalenae]